MPRWQPLLADRFNCSTVGSPLPTHRPNDSRRFAVEAPMLESQSMNQPPAASGPAPRKKYVRAIGPRLRLLLYFIFAVVAILSANSVYLGAISFLEWIKSDPNTTYQSWFYMLMFGTHLGLGLLLVLPVVVFGLIHIRNAHDRPNRRAVTVGYVLFAAS